MCLTTEACSYHNDSGVLLRFHFRLLTYECEESNNRQQTTIPGLPLLVPQKLTAVKLYMEKITYINDMHNDHNAFIHINNTLSYDNVLKI